MRRRNFIVALGSATIAWSVDAFGQTSTRPVIGILSMAATSNPSGTAAFLEGLKEAGYARDRTLTVELRGAEGHYDRLPRLAAELVALRVSLIATVGGEPAALAAQGATSTIPIVFTVGSDPVKAGLVESLNRPGGNITGTSMLSTNLVAKQLQLLHELTPSAASVAILINPNAGYAKFEAAQAASAVTTNSQRLIILKATNDEEIDAAFGRLAEEHVGGLVVSGDIMFTIRSDRLVGLAARYSIAAIYPWPSYIAAGGLMIYGPDLYDAYRQSGGYAARILKGENPADLPVLQSTKFPFVINLKTAKALGVTIPSSLLARADQVIE